MRSPLHVTPESERGLRQLAAFNAYLPMYGAFLMLFVLGLQLVVRQLMPTDNSMADLTRPPSHADRPTVVYSTNIIGANGRYGHPATTLPRLDRFGA